MSISIARILIPKVLSKILLEDKREVNIGREDTNVKGSNIRIIRYSWKKDYSILPSQSLFLLRRRSPLRSHQQYSDLILFFNEDQNSYPNQQTSSTYIWFYNELNSTRTREFCSINEFIRDQNHRENNSQREA